MICQWLIYKKLVDRERDGWVKIKNIEKESKYQTMEHVQSWQYGLTNVCE